MTAPQRRTLLLFTLTRMDAMLAKGNVWYLRHYESHFQRVYVAYLLGSPMALRRRRRTVLVSLGSGGNLASLLLAPFRLLALARRLRPEAYLTADIFFSWWTALAVRVLRGARIVLMPVSIPPEVYAHSGRGIIGLPPPVERVLIRLSFHGARRVIMGRNSDTSIKWLRSESAAARKLKLVALTPEELPPLAIYDGLAGFSRDNRRLNTPPLLLYVGRLHPEKLPTGLIDMLAHLRDAGVSAELAIAGDGASRAEMEARAERFGVRERVRFLGFLQSAELVPWYRRADVFISTVTGTSLREAGLFGLPVVGYRVDWVKDLMRHGTTALLVEPGDAKGLAMQVAAVLRDAELRVRIASEFNREASRRWEARPVGAALADSFADL